MTTAKRPKEIEDYEDYAEVLWHAAIRAADTYSGYGERRMPPLQRGADGKLAPLQNPVAPLISLLENAAASGPPIPESAIIALADLLRRNKLSRGKRPASLETLSSNASI